MTTIEPADTIGSLEELLAVTWRLREDPGPGTKPPRYLPQEAVFVDGLRSSVYRKRGRSLDLWFRGQCNGDYALAPGAFRLRERGDDDPNTFYEEASATNHFTLRRPEYRSQCSSDFEWLSLFQHYGGLTRLLDWSENATVAAFFAVQSLDEKDASLYVLNAGALNSETMLVAHDIPLGSTAAPVAAEGHLGICMDTSPDVILRSTQAFCRSEYEWRSRLESVLKSGLRAEYRWLSAALALLDESAGSRSTVTTDRQHRAELFREKLTYPVAVFPHRSNARLVAQAGMFTLHGGKGSVGSNRDLISRPVPIEQLAARQPNRWLLRYRIPADKKHVIRAQLHAIGVHKSTLFPEVQSDGEIMRDLWCQ